MYQQRLAALEAAALEHVVPNREECFRDGGSLGGRQAARNGQCMSLVGDAVLRVAAAADQGGHLIAFFPACAPGAARHDDAGNFKPWYVSNPWRRRVHAHALGDIGTVDPRGDDLDENLARAGLWHRALLRNERLRSACGCDADCGHGGGDRRPGRPYRPARSGKAWLPASATSDNAGRTL